MRLIGGVEGEEEVGQRKPMMVAEPSLPTRKEIEGMAVYKRALDSERPLRIGEANDMFARNP